MFGRPETIAIHRMVRVTSEVCDCQDIVCLNFTICVTGRIHTFEGTQLLGLQVLASAYMRSCWPQL
jgi:hypothetical protein